MKKKVAKHIFGIYQRVTFVFISLRTNIQIVYAYQENEYSNIFE